ncbi:ISA2 [Candida jiufengensis]|uniref:ISA2 n=1 Tax=Candida jiufengensis TaxID=497108 RepID=UPI0022252CAD|nr:ISA2 [Candida jiufengensis]KAI5952587.1 ISA2 [Candida jiufengensis]
MISRYSKIPSRYIRILPRVSSTCLITHPIRYNSSTTTTKTLKPSTFASFPEPDLPTSQNIDDFKSTKLVYGSTKKTIAITDRASSKLNSIKSQNPQDSALQIQVESGGCHGFQYNLNLINLQNYLNENKTKDDIFVFEKNGGNIILDDSSLTILQDSKLDYTKELIGSQFKIIDSPYTSTACGCGASFDFDFEKLEQKEKEREN